MVENQNTVLDSLAIKNSKKFAQERRLKALVGVGLNEMEITKSEEIIECVMRHGKWDQIFPQFPFHVAKMNCWHDRRKFDEIKSLICNLTSFFNIFNTSFISRRCIRSIVNFYVPQIL